MARTRWPPGPVNPGLLPGQADQTGSAGGCHNLGPGRQIVSKDSPSAASADSEVRPGPRPPTLRPNRDTTREAGPEALPTSSLPTMRWLSMKSSLRRSGTERPVMARAERWARRLAHRAGMRFPRECRRPPSPEDHRACALGAIRQTGTVKPGAARPGCGDAERICRVIDL